MTDPTTSSPDLGISRCARAEWRGGLESGSGTVRVDSGAFDQQVITLASRAEELAALTSPEELLAAAQASCLAMTFASLVDLSAGREARVTVEAICTTRIVNGVPRVAATEFLVSTSGLEQSRAMIEVELQRALHFSAMAGSLGEVASITAELVTD